MGSNPSPSAEEETPDRMSVDPTSVSPVLDPNLNPMDETDLPDVGAISLSSPESLRREGHPKKEEEEEEERQRRRMHESDEPEEPAGPEEIPPDVEDLAGHISYFCLPKTLFENHKVGPGIEPLGLPVGVHKNDPFEPSDFGSDMTIESRLEHYRLVLVNFTSTGAFRWNVASFNFRGRPIRQIKLPAAPQYQLLPGTCRPRKGFVQDLYVPVDAASLEYGARAELAQLVVVSARPASGGRGEQRKARMEENRYYIPFYRDEDYEGKDPAEEKAKVAQLMISALNAYRLVPFAQYQIISEPIDEHSLQELTWNFL
ncbi:hypothetical protein N7527_005809 [Penicillium freii]|nr:hypothetical protein N7527_005809 [Penicillium freii]